MSELLTLSSSIPSTYISLRLTERRNDTSLPLAGTYIEMVDFALENRDDISSKPLIASPVAQMHSHTGFAKRLTGWRSQKHFSLEGNKT